MFGDIEGVMMRRSPEYFLCKNLLAMAHGIYHEINISWLRLMTLPMGSGWPCPSMFMA